MSNETPLSGDTAVPSEPSGPSGRSRLPLIAILAAVAAILGVAIVVTFFAMQNLPQQKLDRHAMVITALDGIEAVIVGDGSKLAKLSDATMKSQITDELLAKMSVAGLDAEFSDPQWNGDSFVVMVTTTEGQGVVVGGPVPDGKNVVIFRTMGRMAPTTGGVTLAESGSSWVITQFAAGPSAPSTASASPTATPPATTTP